MLKRTLFELIAAELLAGMLEASTPEASAHGGAPGGAGGGSPPAPPCASPRRGPPCLRGALGGPACVPRCCCAAGRMRRRTLERVLKP